jgi:hypothetical protein
MDQRAKSRRKADRCGRWWPFALALLLLAPAPARAVLIADFIFVVDTSASMQSDLDDLASVVDEFPLVLEAAGIDGRFAVVAFATNRLGNGPVDPRLTLSFTSDPGELSAAIGSLSSQIVRQTESGTEAIDFALDQLQFRPEAVKNIILVTDEDDDRPASIDGNREPPGLGWGTHSDTAFFQGRVDATAQALIAQSVLVNMIINPNDVPTQFQYGSPDATVTMTTPDGRVVLNKEATLLALAAAGFQDSLQGQLLDADILARAFRIADLRQSPTSFWRDFFEVKAQEVIPEPASLALLVGALAGLLALRRVA